MQTSNSRGYLIAPFGKFALFIDNHYLIISEPYNLNIAADIPLYLFKLKLSAALGGHLAYPTLFSDEVSIGR